MSEQFRPSEPEDESKAVARRADKVDRALDASKKPTTPFSGLRRLIAGLMAGAAVASGEASEAQAEKHADTEQALSAVQKSAESRSFDFDEDAGVEKARELATKKHHADILEKNKKPAFHAQSILGIVSIDHRKGAGSAITKVEGKDPREEVRRGDLRNLFDQALLFSQTVATSEQGEADMAGYDRDEMSLYEFAPASGVDGAKTTPLGFEMNMGNTDPRSALAPAEEHALIKRLSDKLGDELIERSGDPAAVASSGKIIALEKKTQSAVLEGTKETLRHQVMVEQFQTRQPISFRVEKRGENFWLVGVRYEMTLKTTVASVEK